MGGVRRTLSRVVHRSADLFFLVYIFLMRRACDLRSFCFFGKVENCCRLERLKEKIGEVDEVLCKLVDEEVGSMLLLTSLYSSTWHTDRRGESRRGREVKDGDASARGAEQRYSV